MGAAGVRRVDAPHRPPISFAAVFGAFLHGFVIVGVLLAFREHEEIFVRPSGPILHAFRHGVWLVPDDVTAEEPAIVLQGECEPPRDAEQILVFETRRIVRAHIHGAVGIFLVGGSPSAVSARVAVADIQPHDPVLLEDALHLRENCRQSVNETCQSGFEADLPFDSVIAKAPVRRRRHDTLHRLAGKTGQREVHVAFEHGRIGKDNRHRGKQLNDLHGRAGDYA